MTERRLYYSLCLRCLFTGGNSDQNCIRKLVNIDKFQNIHGKAVRSVKWVVLTESITRTVPSVVFVVLARLLTPVDFGLIAAAQVVISFCQLLWDGGLSQAIIQTSESKEDAANAAFWSNLFLALVLYIFVFVTAPWLAVLFDNPQSVPIFRILGLQILIGSTASIQHALLIRELDFRRIFWPRVGVSLLPGLFSVPLAYLGYGVWALVIGTLVGSLITSWLFWVNSSWRPKFSIDLKLLKKLLSFGKWIMLDALIGWFIVWGDSLAIGFFCGVHDLGIYRTASNIVGIIFGLSLSSITPVLYPTFSRLQADRPALRKLLVLSNKLIITVALPLGVGLFIVSSQVFPSMLGSQWEGTSRIIGLLGIQTALGWLVGCNPDVYRAIGQPDIQTRIGFVSLFFYVPTYLLAAPFGLFTFALARIGLTLAVLPIHVFALVKIIGMSPFYLWPLAKTPLTAVLIMVATLVGLEQVFSFFLGSKPNVLFPLILICTGAICYSASVWFLDRKFALSTISFIERAFRK